MKKINLIPLFLAFSTCLWADGAQGNQGNQGSFQRQLKTLEYKFANQDQELAFVKERLKSFETILEAQEQEVSRLVTQAKDSIKKTVANSTTQLNTVEKLVCDLKAFKKQANDLAQTVSELQKHVKEKDEVIANQASSIKELENALRLLASAMQTKSGASREKLYEVKSGDTLDKIAKECHTTISALKNENNMQNDKIFPGQKLQLP